MSSLRRMPRGIGWLLLFAPIAASASTDDPSAPVALSLAVVLAAALLGADVAVRLGQPAVLGELLAGVLLGNLGLFGFHALEGFKTDASIDLLARLGVLVLLFEVGLQSTVGQMMKVGGSALLVAVLGVVAPFGLGWVVSALLLPGESAYVHAFIGATLTATSVGITARVLQDTGSSQTDEARVILGAAVIDDVLGLVILAVVSGVIAAADQGGTISLGAVGAIVGKALGFLVGAIVLGMWVSRKLFQFATSLRSTGVLLGTSLAFAFGLSWLAAVVGLAPIVGAFAAGLLLEETHFKAFEARGEEKLHTLIQPISRFLVPVFFVLMGLRTELRSFTDPAVLGLAGALTVAAILGKQVCAFGVLKPGVDRLSVGIGMIPRGEVGLIFANIGLSLTIGGHAVVSQAVYSAMVVMVIATTLVTPPALKWALSRRRGSLQGVP